MFVTSKRDIVNRHSDEIIVPEEFEEVYEKLNDINACAQGTDSLQSHAISYIANVIEKKLKEIDQCAECIKVFSECRKVENTFLSSKFTERPCLTSFKICKEADQFMKLQLLRGNINFNTIYYSILNNIDTEHLFVDHDFKNHPTHKLYLIRALVDGYIRFKGLCIARTATQELHLQNFRHKFRKLIHLYGQ